MTCQSVPCLFLSSSSITQHPVLTPPSVLHFSVVTSNGRLWLFTLRLLVVSIVLKHDAELSQCHVQELTLTKAPRLDFGNIFVKTICPLHNHFTDKRCIYLFSSLHRCQFLLEILRFFHPSKQRMSYVFIFATGAWLNGQQKQLLCFFFFFLFSTIIIIIIIIYFLQMMANLLPFEFNVCKLFI